MIVLGGGTCSFRCVFNIQCLCSDRAGMCFQMLLCGYASVHFFPLFFFWQVVMFRLKVISLSKQSPCYQWSLMGASFVEVGHVMAVSKMDGRHLEGLQGAEGRDNSMQGLGEPNPGSTSQHCKWDFRDIVLLSFLKNSAFCVLKEGMGI